MTDPAAGRDHHADMKRDRTRGADVSLLRSAIEVPDPVCSNPAGNLTGLTTASPRRRLRKTILLLDLHFLHSRPDGNAHASIWPCRFIWQSDAAWRLVNHATPSRRRWAPTNASHSRQGHLIKV